MIPPCLHPDEEGITTVFFEETGERRIVRRICRVCDRAMQGEFGITLRTQTVAIVSPAGIGHAQSYDVNDKTWCGKDATGLDWWWRL